MKLLKLITTALFTVTVLCSCDFDERVTWSPDGKRMAVLADRLRIADNENISTPLLGPQLGQVSIVRWLPDNHHALIVRRIKHQAKRRPGKSAQTIEINTDYVQMFDFTGDVNDVKAIPGAVLYKTNQAIVDLRLSPNGRLAAISQPENGRHKLSVITMGGSVKVVAKNVSRPDWSRDSRSIYFFRDVSPKDSGYITFIPVSTICNLPVADSNGALLAVSARHDLGQCAGEITGGGRLRVLADGSLLFCTTPIKLPAPGLMFGLSDRALFRFKPAVRENKATVEQITIEGPALGNALETFEPNEDGSRIAVLGNRGAVYVISDSGKVRLVEKGAPDSEQANTSYSFGFAPSWRSKNELCFNARNFDKSRDRDGDVTLQELSSDFDSELAPRQVLSKNWPLEQIDFLKVRKNPKN